MRLSAIIITRNEAANIGACLDSLAFCDERIVVDSGSDDDTVAIAHRQGARVVHNAFAGYGPQKNHALSLAGGEWVLSLDADERVSGALAAEIIEAVAKAGADGSAANGLAANGLAANGFAMPRSSTFCGRRMRHSGWYPDYVLRLFRRGKARFSDDLVHERVVCEGTVKRLRTPLEHHPVLRLEDALSRMDRYSTAGGETMVASGRKVWFATGILRGLFSFFRTYVLRLGFLDGREGFLLAVVNAEGTYYRFMKAWLAGRRRG